MGTTFRSGRAGLARAATAVTMAAAVASMAFVQGAGASSAEQHAMRTHGAHAASTSGGNLVDHGGRVLAASKTYLVFWGPATAWSGDVVPGIRSLFLGFDKSNYLKVAQQYMRQASIGSSYQTTMFDSSPPPNKVNSSTLGNEVVKEFGTVDPSGVYLVYTSNFPRGGNFCAWHSYATSGGTSFSVAYMPNTTGIAGCDPGNLYGLSGTEGLRSLANVSAHEFMEAITDALPANATYGWIDSSGSEIGDKCAWQFTGAVTLWNNTKWQLQEEWDNSITGCNQGA